MSLSLPSLRDGWSWATVADVGVTSEQAVLTGPFGTSLGPDDFVAETASAVPVLTIGCLREAGIDLRKATFVTPAKAMELERYRLRTGDILFSRMATVGRAGLVRATQEAALFNYHIMRLRLRDDAIEPLFFIYYVRSSEVVRAYVRSVNHGMTRDGINTEQLVSMPLPIAPRNQQRRIVEAIEDVLSRLDAAVANLEAAQRKLKAYCASVLKAAVEGRLVPTEAELARREGRPYEPADALLDRILKQRRRRWEEAELAKMRAAGKTPKDDRWKAKYSEPEPPDVDNLPMLPEGWCWSTVDQLAGLDENALCDGPFGSNLKTEHYTDDGPRVIRLQNIGDGEFQDAEAHISEGHFRRLSRHAVHAGDLVVASLGTELPRACQVPGWLGPAIVKADCLRFKVNDVLADPRFVMHALNSPLTRKRVEALVHGVGRPRIGLTLFRRTAIPLPPRSEQERIADHVEELISVARSVDLTLTAQKRRSGRLRQAALAWAFEGKLVDQAPGDEPAEMLLARIRSERGAATLAQPKAKRSRKLREAS